MKKSQKVCTIIAIVVLFCLTFTKVFYWGITFRQTGNSNEYHVVSYQTVWSLSYDKLISFFDNDSAGGYHRIYNPEGKEVYEVYSETLNFDMILIKKNQVEIQTNKVYLWTEGQSVIVGERSMINKGKY